MPVKQFTAAPLLKNFKGHEAGAAQLFDATHRTNSLGPDQLGESPVYDHRTNTLYWVDINGRTISALRFNEPMNKLVRDRDMVSAEAKSAQFALTEYMKGSSLHVTRFVLQDDSIGFISPTTDPSILVGGGNNGLFLVNVHTGNIVARGQFPEKHIPMQRFNDGKVDPTGKIFAGTMRMKLKVADPRPTGSARLYRLDNFHYGSEEVAAVGAVTISNGLGWSPCGTKFYHIDTPAKTVAAYDFDAKARTMANKKVIFTHKTEVDGMCVDVEGFLWVALLREYTIARIHPVSGEIVAEVNVPGAEFVTSCVFGGPKMQWLFITTGLGTTPDVARQVLEKDPLGPSGHLFVADVGVAGMPINIYDLEQAGMGGLKARL